MFTPSSVSSAIPLRRTGMEPTHADHHPAVHAPRIFADTADIAEIRPLLEAGIIHGVTTNPTLLKKAGATSWQQALAMMKDILELLDPAPVSLELTELEEKKMLAQAAELAALGNNAVIKVAVGGYGAVTPGGDPHTGLKVLHRLWEQGIRTNATLIFNTTQAFWAANAGATYVSPFLGRLADYAYEHDHPERPAGNSLYWLEDHKNSAGDQTVANTEFVARGGSRKNAGVRLIQEIVVAFANYQIRAEVLAASIRNAAQLSEVLLVGADILTVPAAILSGVADHPLTDAGMRAFVADAKTFT